MTFFLADQGAFSALASEVVAQSSNAWKDNNKEAVDAKDMLAELLADTR